MSTAGGADATDGRIKKALESGELYDYYINLLATDRRIETC